MTKTVVLTDLTIETIVLDYEKQAAKVSFSLRNASGEIWGRGDAIFWVTIPDPGEDEFGNPLPRPSNWFQLPSAYFSTLTNLRNDADSALSAIYLV